jgi:hypothetical protein
VLGILVMLTDAPVKVVPPVLISVIPPPAAGAAHFNPVDVLESAVRTVSLAPTPSLAGVSAAVAVRISALASKIVGWIPPSTEGILPIVIL